MARINNFNPLKRNMDLFLILMKEIIDDHLAFRITIW